MDMTPEMIVEILNDALAPYREGIEKLDAALAGLQKAVPALAEHGNQQRLDATLEYESAVTTLRSLLDQIGGELDAVMS